MKFFNFLFFCIFFEVYSPGLNNGFGGRESYYNHEPISFVQSCSHNSHNEELRGQIINYLGKLTLQIFKNKEVDYQFLDNLLQDVQYLDYSTILGLLSVVRAITYNEFIFNKQFLEVNKQILEGFSIYVRDLFNFKIQNNNLKFLATNLLDHELINYNKVKIDHNLNGCLKVKETNLIKESFPVNKDQFLKGFQSILKNGNCSFCNQEVSNCCLGFLFGLKYKNCECFLNERKSGFPYYRKNSPVFCFLNKELLVLPDENIMPLLFDENKNNFKFLVIDNWGHYWIVVKNDLIKSGVLLSVGNFYRIPYQVSDGFNIFQTFLNNNNQFILLDELNSRQEISYEEINLDSFFGRLNNFHKPFSYIALFVLTTFSVLFFSLFFSNWVGTCNKCGHPVVKFFGGFCNTLLGSVFGYFGMNLISFRKKSNEIIAKKEKFFISKGFIRGLVVSKYFRDSRKFDFKHNVRLLFMISLGLATFFLISWPLIWFSAIVNMNKKLVNGVAFLAGLSCFLGGVFAVSLYQYLSRTKIENSMIEYDQNN